MATKKETWWIAGGAVAALVVLYLLMKAPASATQTTDNGPTPGSDSMPYYLTFNTAPPGASNYGAPYYGPISFNSGCGCDQGINNVTPQQVAQNTGNNYAFTSAVIPGYLANAIEME